MSAIARFAVRVAALFLCAISAVATAQAPVDPAVWGPYAHVAGTQRRDPIYIVRWHWTKPGAELVEEFILRSGAEVDYSNTITPGAGPGKLRLVSSYMSKEWLGTVQSDGSVLWIGSGFLKMPYRVALGEDGALDMRKVKLSHGAIASIAPATANSRFELIPNDDESSPAPADQAAWGVYSRLAGADMASGHGQIRWSWRDKDTLVEDGGGASARAFITVAGPGALRYVTEDGKEQRSGAVQPDGSVVWTMAGSEPFRVSLLDGGVAYDQVTLRDGVVVEAGKMLRLVGTLPPAARLEQPAPTPEPTAAVAAPPVAPTSPRAAAAPDASAPAPAVAAAARVAPAAPALSDVDALLQSTGEDMCASAKERASRFCAALVALIRKRQADGVVIAFREPPAATPGSRKSAAAGKKGAAATDAMQAVPARWGVMATLVDQPHFVFRTEPERNPPSSPDKGYVSAWTERGLELEWKEITAGSEGPATDIYRWNAKRQKVIGLPLDVKAAYARELSVEAGGISQLLVLRPDNLKVRSLVQAISDGGTKWTNQSLKDGAWATFSTTYDVPSTPEWVAQWQQWQARRREQAQLAAAAEQQRQQAEFAAMEEQALARQQEEADADAEFEAERAQKAAAWNAMAAANEQGLADSIARLNDTTARVQAQQEQYRLQQQYAQQAAQTEQRQRDAENARLTTQRQYETARQFEAQQQAQREAQTQRQVQGLPQAQGAPRGTASTQTDANVCVSRPVVGPNNACGKGTSASVSNHCPTPVDVRMCSMTPRGWDCSARWGLAPGESWSQAWCAGTSQIFTTARNSNSGVPLDSP
ncbi:hypothetical protein [Dyella sp.]|jgi:hypothetical protein|uniref:hypothetical protein n=1 Tax=Dyella sp. TaxID=1869338 RepID=UPI002D789CDE|nr:hypothetical protein [Dyella sp.]HET6432662.1 hypothetical protein [Dyella sp.]